MINAIKDLYTYFFIPVYLPVYVARTYTLIITATSNSRFHNINDFYYCLSFFLFSFILYF